MLVERIERKYLSIVKAMRDWNRWCRGVTLWEKKDWLKGYIEVEEVMWNRSKWMYEKHKEIELNKWEGDREWKRYEC